MDNRPGTKACILLLFAALAPAWRAAEAKVVFTGYADMRFALDTRNTLSGGPFPNPLEKRDFTLPAVGIFAATNLEKNCSFYADITYSKLGYTAGETRLQYAYLQYDLSPSMDIKVGRIRLPLGLYNDLYFYPFQRLTIQPPLFQGEILGLPIADLGVSFRKEFAAKAFHTEFTLFGVNGYGTSPGDTTKTKFREISATGIRISNNLGSTNNNHDIARGGRLEFNKLGGRDIRLGISHYSGTWDPDSKKDLMILNYYAQATIARFGFIVERLHLKVDGDAGMRASFGVSDWKADGTYAELNYLLHRFEGEKPLHAFLQWDSTTAKGVGGGTTKEKLAYSGIGLAYKPLSGMTMKAALTHLEYDLPLLGFNLEADTRGLLFGLAVSF